MAGPNPLVNLCKINTATTGVGTITIGSALAGFRGSSALTDATVYSYAIIDGTNYELGQGTYTASGTTLTRGSVQSSNSNAAISLSGSAIVLVGDSLSWDIFNSISMQNGTSSTTYTPNSKLKFCLFFLTAIGGNGGAGGSNAIGGASGGGGGAGETRMGVLSAATIGASQTVTLGGHASNSTLGALLTAVFGADGSAASGVTPGNAGIGGTGGSGGVGFTGDPGTVGSFATSVTGNQFGTAGGSAFFGGGGAPGAQGSVGSNGVMGGGGGGGGGSTGAAPAGGTSGAFWLALEFC